MRDPAGRLVAVVERKALADLVGGLSNGTLVFELAGGLTDPSEVPGGAGSG